MDNSTSSGSGTGGHGEGGRIGDPDPTGDGGAAPAPSTFPPEITIDDCPRLAETVCQALEACASYPFRSDYGDLETCTARLGAGCEAALALGTLDGQACWGALTAPGCRGFPGGDVPPPCIRPSGTGAIQAPCGSNSECASGFCARKGECGECAVAAGEDGACETNEDCSAGLVCDQGACTAALELGSQCEGQVCALHAWCVEGTCVALGQDGDTCSPTQPCDSTSGFVCAAGVCDSLAFVAEGEVCGLTATQPRCSHGLACVADVPLGERHCATQPDFGDECPDGPCRPPFLCVDGRCDIVEASFCQ